MAIKKSVFILFVAVALIASAMPANAQTSSSDSTIYIDNQLVETNSVIENGRLLVDAHEVAGLLGYSVSTFEDWITLQKLQNNKNVTIKLQLGSLTADVNGEAVELDVAPQQIGEATYIPLRFAAEHARREVGYDEATNTVTINPEYKVVAYFISWGIYARNFNVADIDGSNITHINYAFANLEDGEITLGDSWADAEIPKSVEDNWTGLQGNFMELQRLRDAYPHLQTLISVGGWSWSKNFSDAALTEESRAKFAESAVKFIREYGFDGIDLDWEYPVEGGMDDNITRPEDKENYTLLLQAVRDALDRIGQEDGKHYLLTIASGTNPKFVQNTELDKISEIVDWINLMGYDFHVGAEPLSGNNAPLFADSQDPTESAAVFNVDAGVQGHLNAGVPAKKLVLGMPFYGRTWQGCEANSENSNYLNCTEPGPGTWEAGFEEIADIEANYLNNPNYIRYWNDEAKVPYLYSETDQVFVSYDDPISYGYKTQYIKDHHLGGAMFWEITSDRNHTLQNRLSQDLLP